MRHVFIGFLGILCIISYSGNIDKKNPEYAGVDSRVKKYLNEYRELAKEEGIIFKNKVTIGFKKIINNDGAIGLTTYGDGWREIDFDINYWINATKESRTMLAYHEFSHAFCHRDHDYGEGIKYPLTRKAWDHEVLKCRKERCVAPGHYNDECPLSLLYPAIPQDYCFIIHYNDYIKEMFQRCKAY